MGCALLLLAKQQEAVPLTSPASSMLPDSLLGLPSRDLEISPEEQQIAAMNDYVLRLFGADSARYDFSVYVGYYEQQTQGKSIHSPKNCLPGAGWEAVSSGTRIIQTAEGGSFEVNRYLLANKSARVVVYYWYQGRGRIAWNEYTVKWDLLRDKALHGRSEEALVRIVVPVFPGQSEAEADQTAGEVASRIIDPIFRGLPTFRATGRGARLTDAA
jgi:EpsI family protein